MTERIDLFDSTYRHFTEQVLDAIRKETFGTDIFLPAGLNDCLIDEAAFA